MENLEVRKQRLKLYIKILRENPGKTKEELKKIYKEEVAKLNK